MSLETHAFLSQTKLPDRGQWQAAIDALGFPLVLDPDLDLASDSGFSPCRLKDDVSGFELCTGDFSKFLEAYPHLAQQLSGKDSVVSFRIGGDLRECACVCIATYVLAKDFDGVVYYPDDDLLYSVDELRDEVNQCLAEC